LLADGFTVDMLAGLVREGLASAQRETMRVGGQQIRVERYCITDAGGRSKSDRGLPLDAAVR
jgi:hypothetical protein